MNAKRKAKVLARKAASLTPYRGVVGVAMFEKGNLCVCCVSFNTSKDFWEANIMREEDQKFDPVALERNLMCFAAADVSEAFEEFVCDSAFCGNEDKNRDTDEDISLSNETPVSCAYILDPNTAASIVISPYAPALQYDLLKKMKI